MSVGTKTLFMAVGAAVAAGLGGAGACGSSDLTGSGGSGMVSAGGHDGGIVLTGSGGSLTGAAGSGAGEIVQCDSRPQTVQPLPPDILIVLDTSASMNNDTFDVPCVGDCGASSKWAEAVTAIETVTDGSTPMIANWGLELMSAPMDPCANNGVAVSPGPSNGAAIRDALASRSTPPGLTSPGNTPASFAVSRATANRLDALAATDLNPQVIVLVTDGVPDCNPVGSDRSATDVDGTTQAIANAATVGIGTCVVGLGTAGGPADAALTQMAAAGQSACPISPAYVSESSAAGLIATLNAVATQGGVCRYPIPPPPNSATNPYRLDVSIDGTRIPEDGRNGWLYLDSSFEAFVLYGAACEASQGHTVSVAFRCPLP